MIVINFIRGFFMALADSVPGVSGGTIAFVMGFYDRFITSLNNLVSKDRDLRNESILFLVKLGFGWVFGIVLSVLIITSIFDEYIYQISSLFIGFIIAAIPIVILEEKDTLRKNYIDIIFLFIGLAIVFLISYFNPIVRGSGAVITNVSNMNIGLLFFIFISGMIAISAMVLPGISGSTILLIFGLYSFILNSIKDILTFNFSNFLAVFTFGLGILSGIILIIPTVKHALQTYRTKTIYFITGLMLGSIYAVIVGPLTLDIPKEQLRISSFSIIFFLIGFGFIFSLQYLKNYFEKRA